MKKEKTKTALLTLRVIYQCSAECDLWDGEKTGCLKEWDLDNYPDKECPFAKTSPPEIKLSQGT